MAGDTFLAGLLYIILKKGLFNTDKLYLSFFIKRGKEKRSRPLLKKEAGRDAKHVFFLPYQIHGNGLLKFQS